MPVVGSSAYNTAGQITALVRSLLNDAQGNLFTDAVLLPYANSAYRKVQRALGNAGAGGFLQDDEVADTVVGFGTPVIDAQPNRRTFAFIHQVLALNGSQPLFIGKDNSNAIQVSNMGGQTNLGNPSYFSAFTGGAFALGSIGVASGGRFFSTLSGLPPAPTLSLSAGGSVSVGTHTFQMRLIRYIMLTTK